MRFPPIRRRGARRLESRAIGVAKRAAGRNRAEAVNAPHRRFGSASTSTMSRPSGTRAAATDPDPVRAALIAERAGADGITAHLREDRRHITDDDIDAADGRADAAAQPGNGGDRRDAGDRAAPPAARRLHRAGAARGAHHRRRPRRRRRPQPSAALRDARLARRGIRVSLFIEPDPRQIDAAQRLGAPVVELHTGAYCEAAIAGDAAATERQLDAAAARRRGTARRSALKSMPATASPTTRWSRSRRSRRSSSSISAIS